MNIRTKHIFYGLMVANISFIALHIVLHHVVFTRETSSFFLQLVERSNVDREASIPTWFSQTLLLVAAVLLAYIGVTKRMLKDRMTGLWLLLAALFFYASIDEGSELHELAIEPIQNLLGIESGMLFFAWVIPAIIILGLVGIVFLRFFFHLPRETKILFAVAVVAILGAMSLEMISGAYWQSQDFQYDMRYRTYNAFEEGLENTAFILIIYALARYIAAIPHKKRGQVTFISS